MVFRLRVVVEGHIIVYLEMSKTKGKQMIHYYVAIINRIDEKMVFAAEGQDSR